MLGAHIVELYSGLSFPKFVDQRIFSRLNAESDVVYSLLKTNRSDEVWGNHPPVWMSGPDWEGIIARPGGVFDGHGRGMVRTRCFLRAVTPNDVYFI